MARTLPSSARREPVECPQCAEPTMTNVLADGTLVCCCAAERALAVPDPRLAAPPAPPK